MPSPFPGMDPYLERPVAWPIVHSALISTLDMTLNAVLPAGFRSQMNERLYIAEWGQQYIPDLIVTGAPPAERRAGTTVATPEAVTNAAGPRILRIPGLTIRERFLEVISLREPEARVVTTIEVLSPANKESGRGREDYKRKQRDLLDSETNLLEIDLLRAGEHTLAPPKEAVREMFGGWDYAASLHRDKDYGRFEIWAWRVRDALPTLFVPLTDELPDIRVDLKSVLDRAYDVHRLDPARGYVNPPEPPLAGEDAAWADALLRGKGLR